MFVLSPLQAGRLAIDSLGDRTLTLTHQTPSPKPPGELLLCMLGFGRLRHLGGSETGGRLRTSRAPKGGSAKGVRIEGYL